MGKMVFAVFLTAGFCMLNISGSAFAAEEKAPAAKTAAPAARVPTLPAKPSVPPLKSTFGMLTGTLLKVDNSDPANVKLEVKNDADETTHVVSLTPWTNVTKVTDVSELKIGDTIRVMTRKMEDKEVAMGIMFGKIKPMPKATPQPGQLNQPAPVTAPKK